MSEQYVEVPFNKAEEQATLLLAEAEKSKDYNSSAVRTITGGFLVPKSLAEAAGVDYNEQDQPDLSVRNAEVPGEYDLPETTRLGAGPTGRTDSNLSEDAEQGTVQNEQGEQKMGEPRTDPEPKGSESRQTKKAAKKSTSKQKSE